MTMASQHAAKNIGLTTNQDAWPTQITRWAQTPRLMPRDWQDRLTAQVTANSEAWRSRALTAATTGLGGPESATIAVCLLELGCRPVAATWRAAVALPGLYWDKAATLLRFATPNASDLQAAMCRPFDKESALRLLGGAPESIVWSAWGPLSSCMAVAFPIALRDDWLASRWPVNALRLVPSAALARWPKSRARRASLMVHRRMTR